MPRYEFVCKSCEKGLEVMLTLAERAKAKSKCPSCGSEKVTPQLRSSPPRRRGRADNQGWRRK